MLADPVRMKLVMITSLTAALGFWIGYFDWAYRMIRGQKAGVKASRAMKTQPWLPVIAVALTAFSPSARAQLLANGSFESPVAPANDFVRTSVLPGWTVSGDVDVIHMGYWQAADGTQSIDLSGDTGPGTFIEQAFPTLAGQAYLLSFYYANNADDPFAAGSVRVLGATTVLSQDLFHSGSTRQDMGYTRFEQTFVADSASTVLRFTHLDSAHPVGRGLALDGVAITPVSEPGTLVLLGLCGCGVLYVTLRQRVHPVSAAG